MAKYNEVYVKRDNDKLVINPEFLYLTIPSEWVCIYHKLLVAMSDIGKSVLDDCALLKNNQSRIILNCWTIFQSAIACKGLNKIEDAEFLIKYIDKQLLLLYRGIGKSYTGTNYYPITEDGTLQALCSCFDDDVEFTVDSETGQLYEQYLKNQDDNRVFSIQNDDLIVESENKI